MLNSRRTDSSPSFGLGSSISFPRAARKRRRGHGGAWAVRPPGPPPGGSFPKIRSQRFRHLLLPVGLLPSVWLQLLSFCFCGPFSSSSRSSLSSITMRETAKLKLGGMRAAVCPALVLPAVSEAAEEETGGLGPREEAPQGRRANSQAGGGSSPGIGGLRARNKGFQHIQWSSEYCFVFCFPPFLFNRPHPLIWLQKL